MTQAEHFLPKSVLSAYTGGHTVLYGGYLFELCPSHPKANPFGFVPQHRLVVERQRGCFLESHEHVHHRDSVKTNNDPANLQILTRSEHMRLHRLEKRGMMKLAALDEASVREALQCGSLKKAAAELGVHTQTLRNRFPELVEPHKRRSPTRIDDQEAIRKVLAVAPDNKAGYREVARQTGISYRTVQRICERNGVAWTKKTKRGEVHRTYLRKTANRPSLEPCA